MTLVLVRTLFSGVRNVEKSRKTQNWSWRRSHQYISLVRTPFAAKGQGTK